VAAPPEALRLLVGKADGKLARERRAPPRAHGTLIEPRCAGHTR
jgi:hypothetical protein